MEDLVFTDEDEIFDEEISKSCKVCRTLVDPSDHIKMLVEGIREVTMTHFCGFECLIILMKDFEDTMQIIEELEI